MSPEVVVALVSGVFLLITTLITVLVPHMMRQTRDLKEVKHQVKNSHGTNLRDDIDALRVEMRHGFAGLHSRVERLEKQNERS